LISPSGIILKSIAAHVTLKTGKIHTCSPQSFQGCMTLAKRLMLAGQHCVRQLWLRMHCPELAQPAETPLMLAGRVV
jgi:hypothetical protein